MERASFFHLKFRFFERVKAMTSGKVGVGRICPAVVVFSLLFFVALTNGQRYEFKHSLRPPFYLGTFDFQLGCISDNNYQDVVDLFLFGSLEVVL